MTGRGGLSGEHIELCAEGARCENAESLRQTDGDKQAPWIVLFMLLVYRTGAVQNGLLFILHL